jgi:hypothetical protein
MGFSEVGRHLEVGYSEVPGPLPLESMVALVYCEVVP